MPTSRENPRLNRVTPGRYVEGIEPCVPFWIERLGFETTGEVLHGDQLGFLMMEKDDVEVVYQSCATRTSCRSPRWIRLQPSGALRCPTP